MKLVANSNAMIESQLQTKAEGAANKNDVVKDGDDTIEYFPTEEGKG